MPTAYRAILQDFLDRHALPAMLRRGWTLEMGKDPDYAGNLRQDFHVEQPLRTHILNGLYAITRVLEYLDQGDHYRLGRDDFKRVLALYALHDVYKERKTGAKKLPGSEYAIPLPDLEEL